ncbi:hypothetical protein Tco_0655627 [Tanacetum coccineum]|uniref:Uncharacterized protein n=1 Tax=Tanacetum coccineum TaxID=301880 RepID=A0ABQ4X6Z4_9ASTR
MLQLSMPERHLLSYHNFRKQSKDQLEILADTRERINFGPCAFIVTTNALFQADGVEVYDSDCDDVPNAQPSFMANISSYGSDALTEVHNPDNMDNNMINQGVQVMPSSEQSNVAAVQNSNSSTQQDALILSMIEQLKSQENFQIDNSVSNQSAPSYDQYFELNELKAQSQEKDTVIKKLKERIKSLSRNMNEDNVKKDIEEIETINIELDHRVSKLIAENEHLKQTYKQLYDSIQPTRIRSKEQCEAFISNAQIHAKSIGKVGFKCSTLRKGPAPQRKERCTLQCALSSKEEKSSSLEISFMPQDQEENLGKDDEEPKEKVASKRDWFTKPTQPQEPTDPDWNVDKTPQQGQNQSWLMTLASSADKPSKTFDELMSTPIDFSAFIMNGLKINNLTQETLLGPAFRLLKGTRSNYAELEYDFEECYKALSEKLDWENPEGDDYPFDLTKPLPLVMSRNRQKVHVDYFFNNDLKYLQEGISTMTYTTSLTKTKAAQYDIPGIEDMTFYAYARGLQSRHDVYSTKCILVVTRVEVMRKHGYGYLQEIVVRRADNELYRFKEGDFPRLRIIDIEDMLLLAVQNQLTNLLGDDVFEFAIALRMFTRSLVIRKRVKDLQLGVKSFQKMINVTKPETTKSNIKKRDPYTPYQDPQGFIYVDNNGRNRLMQSDEFYKFSDRTLTGL